MDALGNVIVKLTPARSTGPHVLIHAHMDQLGFLVTQVREDGFLRVERVGGVNRRMGTGTEVVVVTPTGLVPGVMGIKAHHFSAPEDEFRIPAISDWYLDLGVHNREQALALGIEIGSVAAFAPRFRTLAGGRVASPSLDNRVGCYILLELASRLAGRTEGCPVTLVWTVLEEFNFRGLVPAVRAAQPDVVIGLDITVAADTPDLLERSTVGLGKGPAIKVMDFHGRGTLDGVMASPKLVAALAGAARSRGLPYQKEVALGLLTEGARVVSELGGLPVGGLSVPTRYTHTPVEMVELADVMATIEPGVAFVERAASGLDLRRGA